MSDRFETGSPSTGPEIVAGLRRLHSDVEAFARSLPADVFVQPQREKWSPADHLRHLSKSLRPVAQGLSLPRFIPGLLFGRGSGKSRSFEALRETYLGRLAAGATAGRFAPSAKPLPQDPDAYREQVLTLWRAADDAVSSRASAWSEADLDRYRFPHPSLGRLTVREMLFFSLYHNAHHMNLVARRGDIGPRVTG